MAKSRDDEKMAKSRDDEKMAKSRLDEFRTWKSRVHRIHLYGGVVSSPKGEEKLALGLFERWYNSLMLAGITSLRSTMLLPAGLSPASPRHRWLALDERLEYRDICRGHRPKRCLEHAASCKGSARHPLTRNRCETREERSNGDILVPSWVRVDMKWGAVTDR